MGFVRGQWTNEGMGKGHLETVLLRTERCPFEDLVSNAHLSSKHYALHMIPFDSHIQDMKG